MDLFVFYDLILIKNDKVITNLDVWCNKTSLKIEYFRHCLIRRMIQADDLVSRSRRKREKRGPTET